MDVLLTSRLHRVRSYGPVALGSRLFSRLLTIRDALVRHSTAALLSLTVRQESDTEYTLHLPVS